MPENPELRKLRDKRYENNFKETSETIRLRISKELKNKFREKIEKDDNYTDMSDFLMKKIKKYVEK